MVALRTLVETMTSSSGSVVSKICSACGMDKPRSDFHTRRASKDGLRPNCKECAAEDKRVYHQKNAVRIRKKVADWDKSNPGRKNENARRNYAGGTMSGRAHNLKKCYGITNEDYDRLVQAQDGVCAVCGELPSGGKSGGKFLDVDHDHVTGVVRGLLCGPCNRGIGQMKDDPQRLRKAAAYLER